MPATAFSGSPVSEGAGHAIPDTPASQIATFAVGGEALYHAFFSYRFRGMPYDLAYVLQKRAFRFKLANRYTITCQTGIICRFHDFPRSDGYGCSAGGNQ